MTWPQTNFPHSFWEKTKSHLPIPLVELTRLNKKPVFCVCYHDVLWGAVSIFLNADTLCSPGFLAGLLQVWQQRLWPGILEPTQDQGKAQGEAQAARPSVAGLPTLMDILIERGISSCPWSSGQTAEGLWDDRWHLSFRTFLKKTVWLWQMTFTSLLPDQCECHKPRCATISIPGLKNK